MDTFVLKSGQKPAFFGQNDRISPPPTAQSHPF